MPFLYENADQTFIAASYFAGFLIKKDCPTLEIGLFLLYPFIKTFSDAYVISFWKSIDFFSVINIAFALDKIFGLEGYLLNWDFESMKERDEFFHNNSANGSLVRGLCSHVNRSSNDTNLDEMDEFALVLCFDWLLIKGTAFTYVLYMAVVSF